MALLSKSTTWMLISLFALLMLAALFNSVMDVLQFRYSESVFAKQTQHDSFLNPSISWRNKWANGDPAQGEAYPGSSTVFVLFTDGWHLAKFFMLTCFEVAILLLLYQLYRFKWYSMIMIFLGMKILFGLTFEPFFKYGLILWD
jgi:hypothetical protein